MSQQPNPLPWRERRLTTSGFFQPLSVHTEAVGGSVCLLTVTGELDASTAPLLRDQLRAQQHRPWSAFVLDLSGLDFCASPAIHLHHELRRHCDATATGLALVLGTGAASRVFRHASYDPGPGVHPTTDAAVAALCGTPGSAAS